MPLCVFRPAARHGFIQLVPATGQTNPEARSCRPPPPSRPAAKPFGHDQLRPRTGPARNPGRRRPAARKDPPLTLAGLRPHRPRRSGAATHRRPRTRPATPARQPPRTPRRARQAPLTPRSPSLGASPARVAALSSTRSPPAQHKPRGLPRRRSRCRRPRTPSRAQRRPDSPSQGRADAGQGAVQTATDRGPPPARRRCRSATTATAMIPTATPSAIAIGPQRGQPGALRSATTIRERRTGPDRRPSSGHEARDGSRAPVNRACEHATTPVQTSDPPRPTIRPTPTPAPPAAVTVCQRRLSAPSSAARPTWTRPEVSGSVPVQPCRPSSKRKPRLHQPGHRHTWNAGVGPHGEDATHNTSRSTPTTSLTNPVRSRDPKDLCKYREPRQAGKRMQSAEAPRRGRHPSTRCRQPGRVRCKSPDSTGLYSTATASPGPTAADGGLKPRTIGHGSGRIAHPALGAST